MRATPLERLAALAAEADAGWVVEEASALASRLREGRYFVACVGQFKRGKSTLLNALVGDNVLPTGIVPVTSVPTVVRYGARRGARVRGRADSWCEIPPESLAEYVSEEGNPGNRKDVTGVEVFVPSLLLESGMCLVDTPGLGSTYERNTAATQAFVPHIDSAIVVIGADPPLAGAELRLIEEVARVVPDLLFVLNKADRVSAAERSEAVAFARTTLQHRLGRAPGRIFEVSARDRLDGLGPTRDWDAFVAALNQLARESGQALVVTAAERGMARLAGQLLSDLAEQRALLVRPLEESERRIAALTGTLSEAEQSVADLGYLFAAEQERLARSFAGRRTAFLAEARALAGPELARTVGALPRRWGPALRRDAMRHAQEIAKTHVIPWLEREQAEAETAYRRITQRFVMMANEFLRRLGSMEPPELAHLPHALEAERGFTTQSKFYFNELIRVARPASPFRFALDAILGIFGATRPILADAGRLLDWLLEMNSARVESDLNDRVLESRRQLEATLRQLLQEVLTSAQRALARAKLTQTGGAQAVQQELARIARLERQIAELKVSHPA